jgi:hypothetical protein
MAGFPKHRRYLVVVTVVAVAAGSLSFASLASAKGGWKWSKGQSLPGSSDSSVIEGLSCPSTSLCLIPANQDGQSDTGVYWSSDPTDGAGAWHFLAVAAPFGGDIACDEVSAGSYYCDVAGNSLWTSGSPTAGWNAESFQNYYDTSTYTALGAVSCWVNVQCIEADGSGNIFSTDAAAVQSGPVAVFPQLNDYAGPSVGCAPFKQGESVFCAAVESNPGSNGRGGEVAWSTDPASGTWTTGDTTGGSDLTSIVCANDALCVALEGGAGESAYIGVTHDAASGTTWAQTWKAVHVPTVGSFAPTLSALTCNSDSLCAISGQNTRGNFVYISRHPAAKLSAWTKSKLHDGGSLSLDTSAAGIACPSLSECIVVSGEGQVSVGKR